jgi:hypothetical protein
VIFPLAKPNNNKTHIAPPMKALASRLLALALLASAALPIATFADEGHGHSHATKLIGPNQGRILTELEPHAEFFVTAERKVRLTFLDDSGAPVAPSADFVATLITGERAAPTTLSFAAEGDTLISTAALPEGQNLPVFLRVKTTPDAATLTIRFQLNLAACPECARPEYACTCAH